MLPPIVEIAISVIIAWALFAILCSIVHEALVQVKSERGRFLKKYLLHQLQDKPNGVNWASLLYMHGSVDLLSRAPEKPTSDISPRLFAETMVDVVANAMIVQIAKRQVPTPYYSHPVLNDYKAGTELLKESDVVSMLRQAMQHAELAAGAADQTEKEAIIYRELVKYLDNWYVEMMERVSTWYKKATRQRLFWLGVLLAAIINLNSIALFEHFEKQPKARAAMMHFYQRYIVYDTVITRGSDEEKTESAVIVKLPVIPGNGSTNPDSSTTTDTPMSPEQEQQLVKAYLQLKKDAMLPVGWSNMQPLRKMDVSDLLKLFAGLLITGIAASFGAPFWFDVLKKVTRISKPNNSPGNAVR